MLKRIPLLLVLLYCTPHISLGQQYQHDWSNFFTLPENSVAYVKPHDIQDDASGNVITVGTFVGTLAFDGPQGLVSLFSTDSDDQDIFLKKCDADGNLLWVKRIGGVDLDKVTDMDIDPDGNIYLTGYFKGNIDFDPGALQVIAIGGQDQIVDGFIAKYTPDGEHIWSKPYFFTGNNPSEGIKYDAVSNTVYATGCYRGPANFDSSISGGILQSEGDRDIYLVNLSPDGDLNWVSGFGSVQDDYPSRLEVDDNGKVYISGTIGAEMVINGQTIGDNNFSQAILVSFDGQDNISVVHDFDCPAQAFINDMTVSGDDLWVVGTYVEDLSVDGIPMPTPTVSSNKDNAFILKSSLSGSPLLIRNITGSQDVNAYSITHDGLGQAVVAGGFEGTQDFDWTVSQTQTLTAAGSTSPFLLGLLNDGSFVFADQLENTGEAYLTAIDYSGNNTYLTTGACNDFIDIALNTSPAVTWEDLGRQFGYEIKLKSKILSAICKEELVLEVDTDGIIPISVSQIDNGSNTLEGGSMEFSLDIEELDCSNTGGEVIVNLTVTDVVFNVTEACQTTIIPLETIPPVALCNDLQISLGAIGIASLSTDDIDNGSYDNCAVDIMLISQSTFSCDHLGTNSVKLTVFDQAGNSANCEAQVTVIDEEMPQLMCEDITLYLNEYGELDFSMLDNMMLATDNCGIASLDLYFDDEDLCAFPAEGETAELIATDNDGNVNSCSLTLRIVDEIKPRLSCKDITLELADVDDEINVLELGLIEFADDNCGIAQIEYMKETLSYNDVGETELEIIVSDLNANSSSCISNINLLIKVSDVDLVYVPNAFSPNQDGSNDHLAIFSSKKVEQITQFTVLDRWGNIHYEVKEEIPENSGLGWDGTMANEASPKGVYFYKLRVRAINGEYYEFSGTVNLL